MGRFSFCLPPFAPDYSGVCGTLFSLGGMIVIHDAAGCTGNYVNYDEPRWYGSNALVYCSGLRELDAVLGNDDRFIKNISETAKKLRPNFIALVGSPVPMVIGTDLEGMAAWIQAETGIPTFGFDTTGLKLYPEGAFRCGKALLRVFWADAEKDTADGERGTSAKERDSIPVAESRRGDEAVGENAQERNGGIASLNIIGDLPLDLDGKDWMQRFRRQLSLAGIEVNASLWDKADMQQLHTLSGGALNVAVTYSGVLLADWILKEHGKPCVAGYPLTEQTRIPWMELVKQAVMEGKELSWGNENVMCGREDGILFLGDQMTVNSMRAEIFFHTGKKVCAGLPFGAEEFCMGEGDLILKDEAQIMKAINDPDFRIVIGDPLYRQLINRPDEKLFLPVFHYAVSSKVAKDACPQGEMSLEQILETLRNYMKK